jgi:hypothetical protein
VRVEGWEALLAAHIADARGKEFAWGERDCALWCADWVRLCTGTDLGADWRGRYTTEKGAARLMARQGYSSLAAIPDRHLPTIPVAKAKRGDVVLNADGCLGICDGRLSHFLTESGITSIETLRCARAWAVG